MKSIHYTTGVALRDETHRFINFLIKLGIVKLSLIDSLKSNVSYVDFAIFNMLFDCYKREK